MTEDSAKTFLAVEGNRVIGFEDGSRELIPGQLLTVPCGFVTEHDVGSRSVNITFESAQTETVVISEPYTVQRAE